MTKRIALGWIVFGSLLFAQKVTQIKFEGLAHLSPSVAKDIADIHEGDPMDAEKINISIKNFFAQGYFKDVWVEKKRGTLIYHFKEKVAIANIDIVGYGFGNDGKELLGQMGLKKGDLYDKAHVQTAKETLISRLEAKGFYDTVVEVKSQAVGTSSVALTFNVNKGEQIKIKKINFVGSKKLKQNALEVQLANKEEDVAGWLPFFNDGVARVDQLEYDSYRVKDVYRKHGYLDAAVSKPLMRVDFGSYNAEVDYQVTEGVQYRVGAVTIEQNIKGLDGKALLSKLVLKKGKIFNVNRMRKDIANLKEAVGNLGYAYANVTPKMRKDPSTRMVVLQYVIQVGQKVTINDVLISGNDSTKDRVIRRYLYLAPGDKFNASDLKDSKNALGRTGFFEKTDIQSQRISPTQVNLLVKVKEAPTGSISAGGGYSKFEGLMLNASYAEKNAFGSGISTNVGFNISKVTKNYNLSLTNPKVWDSQYSLGFSLYKKNSKYTSYTLDQFGGSLNLGKEFFRHFHGSVGLGYVNNQSEKSNNAVNERGDYSQEYIDLLYGDKYKKTSLYAALSFDNTDDYFTPREGVLASLNFEFAGLDGTLKDNDLAKYPKGYGKYTRTSAKLGLYYGVEDWIDYDLIFRFKARMSNISSTDGEKMPIAEKIFMGGVGSVRGFQQYSLTPRENNLRIGGLKRASVSFESSIPLSTSANMRLTAFYDYGVIGENNFDDITRSSAGLVIEWQSPMGPINLVFAKPLDDKLGDDTSVFEFAMGTKF